MKNKVSLHCIFVSKKLLRMLEQELRSWFKCTIVKQNTAPMIWLIGSWCPQTTALTYDAICSTFGRQNMLGSWRVNATKVTSFSFSFLFIQPFIHPADILLHSNPGQRFWLTSPNSCSTSRSPHKHIKEPPPSPHPPRDTSFSKKMLSSSASYPRSH